MHATQTQTSDIFNQLGIAHGAQYALGQPQKPHTIKATLDFLKTVAGFDFMLMGRTAEYVTEFVERSPAAKALDQSHLPLMRRPRVQTFPNLVVDLARFIPKDEDGSTRSRKEFLIQQFGRSKSFAVHIEKYNPHSRAADQHHASSVIWPLQRAFRSLDSRSCTELAFELGPKFKHGQLKLGVILNDFNRTPAAPAAAPELPPVEVTLEAKFQGVLQQVRELKLELGAA